MRTVLSFVLGLAAQTALADTVVANHTIRPQTILSAEHLAVKHGDASGGVSDPSLLIGLETKVALYAGRPVRITDVGPPAIIERNQIVSLVFRQRGLEITAEGRSMDRAGPGETVRVMNLTSRTTVFGRVSEDGRVWVSR